MTDWGLAGISWVLEHIYPAFWGFLAQCKRVVCEVPPRTVLNEESWSSELLNKPKFILKIQNKFLKSPENNFMDLSQGREKYFQAIISMKMHKGDFCIFHRLAYKVWTIIMTFWSKRCLSGLTYPITSLISMVAMTLPCCPPNLQKLEREPGQDKGKCQRRAGCWDA